jgi:MYXO-CTERM domain-containing protein
VNVTTDPAVYTAAGVRNSGVARMMDVNEGSSSCGLNVFGTSTPCQVHRYRNGYATGRILAHEVGHGLGMRHDGGDNGGEYFNGFSAFQWTPLMGNIWPGDRWTNALYQWSKGEYASATEDEDDFANLDRHLDYREDDVPSTAPLRVQGTAVPAARNWGQIGRNTDTDSYSFRIGTGGGRASLKIDRIEYLGGAMLDVDASILNASGSAVAQNNAAVARHAQLDVDLAAGDYTLLIKGGAEGTPANGFSNYSSVGFYSVDGTITGVVDPGMGGGGGSDGMGAGGAGGAGMAGSGGFAGSGSGGGAGAQGGEAGSGGANAGAGGVTSGGAGAGSSGSGNGGASGAGSGASGASVSGMAGSLVLAGNGGMGPGGGAVGSGATGASVGNTEEESGCGCRVTGRDPETPSSLLGVSLLLLLHARRRRSERAATST